MKQPEDFVYGGSYLSLELCPGTVSEIAYDKGLFKLFNSRDAWVPLPVQLGSLGGPETEPSVGV